MMPSTIKCEPVDTGYEAGTSVSKTQIPQLQIIAPGNSACSVAPSTSAMPTSVVAGTKVRPAVTYIVKKPMSQTTALVRQQVAVPVTTSVASASPTLLNHQVPVKTVATKTLQGSVLQQPSGTTPRPVFLVPSIATTATRTTPVYISQSAVTPHKSDSVAGCKADPNNVVCGLVYNCKSPQDGSVVAKKKEYLCNFCFFKSENYTTLSNHLASHIFTCNHCPYKAFTRHEVMTHKQKKHIQFAVDLHSTINAQINVGLSTADAANSVDVTVSQVSTVPSTLGVVKSIVVTSTMANVTATSTVLSQSLVTAKPAVVSTRQPGQASELTTTDAAVPSPPSSDHTTEDHSKNGSYFTYKIHEYSERETMYECDICLYMTKELYDMYDHATTHTIGDAASSTSVDSVTDTPGLIWECLYCSFRVEKQSVLVTHIKSAHVGKTLKMRRQCVSPSSMLLKSPPLPTPKDVPPVPKKVTPVPKNFTLPENTVMPVISAGNIDTQATLWGCYYCSSFHTFDRSAAITHVQAKHKGQKLMITRRRVVSTAASDVPSKVAKASAAAKHDIGSSEADVKSHRKQSLASQTGMESDARKPEKIVSQSASLSTDSDCSSTVTVSRPRKLSKYDSMIAFLNHSNEMIRKQISEIDSAVRSSQSGSSSQSGISDPKIPKTEKSDDSGVAIGSSQLSVRAAAEQANIVHLSELPDDLKVDWQEYFSIDRMAGIARCLKCSHETSGKHAFSHMRVHITAHTLERVWGCPYCEHRSNRRIFMYKHVLSQHPHRPVLLVRRRPYRVLSGPASQRLKCANVVVDSTPAKRLQGPRSVREAKIRKAATDVFVCPSCSRTSVFRGDIRTHIKFVHLESNPQSLRGEVVLRPPMLPSEGSVNLADMKTASVHLVRLEDFPKFAALKRILEEKGETLHHDLDINDGVDENSLLVDTTEMLVLPNSSEMGKYKCPYCIYKTFRPLVIKQHILYRHPEDEIKVCDLRANSRRSKFLYPCALLSCQFITPMKEALYAHIGKNPLHVGNTVTETPKDKCSSDNEPIAKIATRCSSLRSASLKHTPSGSADSTIEDDSVTDGIFSASNDPVLVQFIGDLKGGVATPRLLLKCRYCDLPSSYDPVTIKDHLINEHSRWDPVVLDVKARFFRKESRLYMCPLLSCDFMTYVSRDFVSHLKCMHADMKFLLPVITRHNRKAKSDEHRTTGTKRKHVHVSKSEGSKRAKLQVEDTKNAGDGYPYLCFYCKASCDDRRSVKEHLLEHHPCEFWFICFSEKARIDHKKAKLYLCKSRTCDFFCHSLDAYDSHPCVMEERASVAEAVPIVPSGGSSPEKMYQCSYCTCMMTNVHDIREHCSMEHKSSGGGYTEIQTGFGKNGTVVMNVNSEVTGLSSSGHTEDHLDKNGVGAISSSDIEMNEASDISSFATLISKRKADQNDTSEMKHADHIGIDAVSSQVEDMHTKLNAVMEALRHKKHGRAQKVEEGEPLKVSEGKLTLKLANNFGTEDNARDTVAIDGEFDVDMPEDCGMQSTLSPCVNGDTAGEDRDGEAERSDSSSDSHGQDTKTGSESTLSKTKTLSQGKDGNDASSPKIPIASTDTKALSDQDDRGASESDKLDDARPRGSDEYSDQHAGCRTDSQVTAEEAMSRSIPLEPATESGPCDPVIQAESVTEQQGGSGDDKAQGDNKTNGDPEPLRPPVTISIKITPPKDGWNARRSHGSSSSSDSSDDDSLESDQEDEDGDSSDNSDTDSSSDE